MRAGTRFVSRSRCLQVAYCVAMLTATLILVHILQWPLALSVSHPTLAQRYAVLFDAGSSGTRVHVYRYTATSAATQPAFPAVELPGAQLKTSPGLSTLASDPGSLTQSLQSLIAFAQQQIPRASWHATTVHLMATAGMRMMPAEQSSAVLLTVRGLLATSGFQFQDSWARILPGELEGIYAWAGVNFAAGTLQHLAGGSGVSARQLGPPASPPHAPAFLPAAGHTWGVLEMGGASLQITFLPEQGTLLGKHARNVTLPGHNTSLALYTHSFLGYGASVAAMRLAGIVQQSDDKQDPCLPKGFPTESNITGMGSFEGCKQLAALLLPQAACKHSLCSINGEFLPPLTGVFLGMENLYYTALRLGLAASLPASPAITTTTHPDHSPAANTSSTATHRRGLRAAATPVESIAGGPVQAGPGRAPARAPRRSRKRPASKRSVQAVAQAGATTLQQLADAGKHFCALTWEEVQHDYIQQRGIPQEHAIKVCFGAAYAWVLLHNAFHLEEQEQKIVFSNSIQTVPTGKPHEVNWILGALLLEVWNQTSGQLAATHAMGSPLLRQVLCFLNDRAVQIGAAAIVAGLLIMAIALSVFQTQPEDARLPSRV